MSGNPIKSNHFQSKLHSFAQYLPEGYTYQMLITNDKGQAEDFVFLDVNPAFEKIAGVKSESIIGKRATEVFSRLKTSDFDWISFLGHATLSGRTYDITKFVDVFDRWCRIIVYSPENMRSIIIFQDKTPEIQSAKELERLRILRAMFDEHSAIMLLIEPITGRIINANCAASAFYGYSRDKLKHMRIGEISPPFQEEIKRRYFENQNQENQYLVFSHRLSNGERRTVDVYSSSIHINGKTYCYMIIFDVTNREKYREELYREKELLSLTLDSIEDGVVTVDRDGKITLMNKAAQRITGLNEGVTQNIDISEIFRLKNEVTGKPVESPIVKALRTGRMVQMDNNTVLINRQGASIPVADSSAPIKDEQGNTLGAVMIFRDVTREREQRYMSYHDELTGLYNRRFVIEELKRLNTTRQLPLSIIVGDVNGLKMTNDAFGHAMGDKLLKKAAAALKAGCRKEDIIARWGGDEFLILLPQTPAHVAKNIVQRIKKSLSQRSRGLIQLSISLGYAVKETKDEKFADVLQEAEKWMYRNKLLDVKSYRSAIIKTLLTTLYENSTETEEHSQRMQKNCLAIGAKLNLSNEELNELSLFAMLHDIGKIGVHHQILQKPGPLTPKEWEEVHRHPEIGYRITINIPELSNIAEYILLHHERWDGTGYPKGLKGEEIPLFCRILAVADAYDVMTNGRVYKAACDTDSAIEELKRNAGTQFDPKIVDLFTKICKN